MNVTHDLANKYEKYDEDGIKFTYVRFPVDDFASENLSVYFTKGVKFIEDALSENTTNVVLVHWFQGISRSATMLCAYLISKYSLFWNVIETKNYAFHEAIDHIKNTRYVMPNAGFKKQLYHYQVNTIAKYDLPKGANAKYYHKGIEIPDEYKK